MANNSQFGDLVNFVLEEEGYTPIAQANFTIKTALERPQLQVQHYFNDANALLFVPLQTMFAQRQFNFSTTAGTVQYPVDDSCNITAVTYHSLRCIDITGRLGRVNFLNYENEFREMYRDFPWPVGTPTLMQQSRPTSWTTVCTAGGGINQQNYILMAPIPDAAYNFEYRAKLNQQPLVQYTDQVLYPPEYEHILTMYGRAMLRGSGDPAQYAQQAFDAVKSFAPRNQDDALRASFRGLKMGP